MNKLTNEQIEEIFINFADESVNDELHLSLYAFKEALNKAINYTRCCKSDSEQLCEHPMSERADIVGSRQTYCLKCSTTL